MVGAVPVAAALPIEYRSRSTPPNPEQAATDIAAMTEEIVTELVVRGECERRDVLGVGVGCPGPLDLETGSILRTPNLEWDGFPVRDRVSDALALPATLDNDGNCAAYGEWWRGAGKGSEVMIGVTLGTGIGGGLVFGGRVVRGVIGGAGEIGHMTIELAGRRCGCGNEGCLEAYAAGPSIAARAREGIAAGRVSSISDRVDGDLSRVSAETVSAAVLDDDAFAIEVMAETGRMLGAGLAGLVNVLNPDRIVVVGGVARAGESLFAPLRDEIRRRAFANLAQVCAVVPGALGGNAGVIGAAGVFLAQQAGEV